MPFEISLNTESAMVLLWCLECGENSISQVECEKGMDKVIKYNVEMIRKQIVRPLANEVILQSADAVARIEKRFKTVDKAANSD